MKRRLVRFAGGLLGLVVLAVGAAAIGAQLRWKRTFEVPAPALRASTDSGVIARGRYLAYGPAHCASCHTAPGQARRIEAGEEPPLTGGNEFRLPFAVIRTPNLTPDGETGIGRVSDAQLARMLRHGVRRDGRAALPFMPFQEMSDDDIVAVISFLRSQPAVRHAVPEHEVTFLGKAILAYLIEPIGPSHTPPATAPEEAPTVERGSYVANQVANCAGCHSKRSPLDGSFTGPRFAGGMTMDVEGDPEHVLVTPNLTPDPATGRITGWSEDHFVARFRAGKTIAASHMPWGAFGRMSDTDLRAIYRYLRTLEPVVSQTGPSLQRRPE